MCSLHYCKHEDECNVPCKHTTITTCMHRLRRSHGRTCGSNDSRAASAGQPLQRWPAPCPERPGRICKLPPGYSWLSAGPAQLRTACPASCCRSCLQHPASVCAAAQLPCYRPGLRKHTETADVGIWSHNAAQRPAATAADSVLLQPLQQHSHPAVPQSCIRRVMLLVWGLSVLCHDIGSHIACQASSCMCCLSTVLCWEVVRGLYL